MRSRFETVKTDDDAITIRDLNGPVSVTNDAEEVVACFYRAHMENRRLYYYDSDGALDELLHDGKGRFLGFAPGPGRSGR